MLFCFYGMFSRLLVLQWCCLLQGRSLFQQNLEWVVLTIPSCGVWQAFCQLCWSRTEPLQQQQPIFVPTSPGKQGLSSTVPFIFLQTLWCFLFILCLLSSSPVWCPQLIQQCREWVRSIRKVATQNQASILCKDWSTHHAVVQSNLNFNYRDI